MVATGAQTHLKHGKGVSFNGSSLTPGGYRVECTETLGLEAEILVSPKNDITCQLAFRLSISLNNYFKINVVLI